MSVLIHHPTPATALERAERPPLRLLERWPRPMPAVPAQEPTADAWLVRALNAWFDLGERVRSSHRMGSWERLR